MNDMRLDSALDRLLDALEAELLTAPDEEIHAALAETGMSAKALMTPGNIWDFVKSACTLEAETGDAAHRGGGSTAQLDLRSDLSLNVGDD